MVFSPYGFQLTHTFNERLSGTDLYTQTNTIFNGVSSYLTGGGSSGTSTPFAFLNYIVFDNNFNRVASGHSRVSSITYAKHLLSLNNVNITQKGYVYIWVSNESNQNQNTYFDDLKVTHHKGAILQEDHYYPFGANINALSSTAPLSKPNKYKFSGNEQQTEFNLNLYDFNARFYDPVLGRFAQVDPMSEERDWLTPYNYVQNNPLIRIDPAGNIDITILGKNNSSVTIKTDLIDVRVNASAVVGDLGGNYEFEGEDLLVAALDIVGVVDPTPTSDALAATLEFENGNFWGGLASAAGVVPIVGDLAKVGKVGKHVKTINKAIDAVSQGSKRKNVTRTFSTRKRAKDARPKPAPAQQGKKRVTRQTRNKNGEGNKMKTDGRSQTEHFHDKNHGSKKKTNVHYRTTKKIKKNEQ